MTTLHSFLRHMLFSILVAAGWMAGCAPSPPAEAPFDQATVPKIDFHAHYTHNRPYFDSLFAAWNMRALVVEVIHVDDVPRRNRWPAMRATASAHPDYLLLCPSFDATRIDEPNFAEQVVAQLKEDFNQGAQIVKVWKEIGMVIRDAEGSYIQIDDPRFQPIWDFLAGNGIPVLAHIGEPRAAWLPLDEDSPHYNYYKNNPQYHAYQHPEVPRWETIMAARDRWLARNPDLIVIGAHLGSMAYDVDEVARRLDRFPNFYVEPAARFGDLAKQPSDKVRDFFIRYQDRILYGTDLGTGQAADSLSAEALQRERERLDERFRLHWDYLTSADTIDFGARGAWFSAVAPGLALPPEVVRKIYADNAARLLRL